MSFNRLMDRKYQIATANEASRLRRGRRRSLVVEGLEERTLLSTYTVNALTDTGAGSGTLGDLRYAITQANSNPGSTIVFESGVTGTIQLANALPALSANITITGPGASVLTVNGGGSASNFTGLTVNSGVTASISGLTISNFHVGGPSAYGGGINNSGTLTITDSTISNDVAGDSIGISNGFGGAIYNSGTLTITGSTLSNNSTNVNTIIGGNGSVGGGIYNSGTLTITGSILSNDSAVENSVGGGVYNHGTATIINTLLSNCSARLGGGVYNDGLLAVRYSTFSNDSAEQGGALYNNGGVGVVGTATISSSLLSSNSVTFYGGAFYNDLGTLTINNSTVCNNSAQQSGGGICFQNGVITVTCSTVTGNSAPYGAGISAGSSNVKLYDTIVSGNTGASGGPNVYGLVSSASAYNLIGDGTGLTGISNGSNGNLIGTASSPINPLLSALGNYGGSTQTYALLPGSPAIGAGSQAYDSQNNPITTDQRGLPLDSPTPDIGAFQSQGFVLAPLAGSTPQSTLTGAAFTNPLALSVMAHNPSEPVAGGIVTYTPPAAGASANLTSTTCIIGQNGVAQVGATANSTAGSYTIEASTAGAAKPVSFSLSNLLGVTFSGLSNPSTTYGASATFTGTLSSGTQTPAGQSVQVTVGSLSQSATIRSNGTFSATLSKVSLEVAGSPYLATLSYTSDGTFASANALVTLTVAKASPILSVSDSGGTFNGTTFPAAATIAGVVAGVDNTPGSELEGIGPTVAYYAGTYTNISQLAGATPLAGAPSGAGSYTVEASFAGSADYVPVQALANFTVSQATPTVTVNDAGGTYNGTAYTAAAGVTGVSGASGSTLEGIGLTISYYAGTYTTAGQLARLTPVPGAPGTAGAYTVQAKFAGSTDYTAGSALANFTISRATPTVTWSPPGSIVYGTPLSVTQLDASANVPGSFDYAPGAGAVLDAGSGQGLSVIFTPNDPIDYTTATLTTQITVTPARPILSLTAAGGIFDGRPFPASVTITGSGRDGTPATSLQQVYPVLNYYVGSDLSGPSLGSVPPVHPGNYTVVATFPGSLDYAATRSGPVTFVIGKGNPTIALASSGGSAVFGQTVTFVATVTAIAAGTGGSVTFYDGTVPLGITLVNASGQAILATSSLAAGSHSITATYGGNADLHSATSGVLAESVGKAATQVALVLLPIFKKKQLVSVNFKTQVRPTVPGGGVPTGALTFEILTKSRKKVTVKVIGAAALGSGSATLALKPKSVLNKPITILYGGDANFTSGTATSPVLTQRALKSLARPMVALHSRGQTRIGAAIAAGRD